MNRTVLWVLVPVWAACSGRPSTPASGGNPAQAGVVRYDQAEFAASTSLADPGTNPFTGNAKAIEAGRLLFSSMNCDGCHGGGEGWVGPSLSDGRWRYGGSDGAVFRSVYFGRPNGMPGYGELLAPQVIWQLVSYIRSLPVPNAVPTQSW